MTEAERLHQMVEELWRIRNKCEPKSNQNPRYPRLSNAVSAILWVIDDLRQEETTPKH